MVTQSGTHALNSRTSPLLKLLRGETLFGGLWTQFGKGRSVRLWEIWRWGLWMRTIEHPARLLSPTPNPTSCVSYRRSWVSQLWDVRKRGPKPADVPVFLQQFFSHLMKLSQILDFVAEDSIQCSISSIELGIPEGAQCIIPWGLCSVWGI